MTTLRSTLAMLLLLPTLGAAAQTVDLSEYPRSDLDDLAPRHREWLRREVVWIITDVERDVFLRLQSDARRDAFIDRFWGNRDPSPGTPGNEYRDLHYARLDFADRQFGRETPRAGWQTDRGRVFILLGEPQSINRLPNTNQAVPIEVWFYSVDPALGIPPFFYLIFFKDRGVGEYRLYSPAIDGPSRLLNASGQAELARGGGSGPGSRAFGLDERGRAVRMLSNIDAELGNAAGSLIPGEGGNFGVSPLRSEMVLARVFGLPDRLMPQAVWAYNVLTGVTESAVRFETLPIRSVARVFVDPTGTPFLHFGASTAGDRLNLNNFEDRYYVTFDLSTSIQAEDLRVVHEREPRTLQADLDAETARRLRGGPVTYVERIPVVDGDYDFDFVIENNVTREYARAAFDLRVPRIGGAELDPGDPLLVLDANDAGDDYDPFADQFPFQVGARFLIPAFEGPFAADAAAHVFWQIYVPAARREPLLAIYSVRGPAGDLRTQKALRVDPRDRDRNGMVDHLTAIDLKGLAPGRYELIAELDGDDFRSAPMPFEIVAADAFVKPFIHGQWHPPAPGADVRLERARQLRVLGRTDAAIAELDEVLRRESRHGAALELQIELLQDAGRFAELARLLSGLLVEEPNNADLLVVMGEAQAQSGEHRDAIRFYERARIAGAAESTELLNALAAEYYAVQELGRARELFERSLVLDPEQPEVRRLVQELLSGA